MHDHNHECTCEDHGHTNPLVPTMVKVWQIVEETPTRHVTQTDKLCPALYNHSCRWARGCCSGREDHLRFKGGMTSLHESRPDPGGQRSLWQRLPG